MDQRADDGARLSVGVAASAGLSDAHFRQLLDKLPAAAYTCGPDGLITYFNQRAVELWGRSPRLNDDVDRYCGSFKLYTVDHEPLSHEDCWMARALHEERGYNGQEIIIERPDGRLLEAQANANPIYDDEGALIGAVNVLIDVTEQRGNERALRRSEVELRDFFDNAAVGLHWVGADGTILRANRTELEMLGYREDEYVGRHIADFHADRDVIDDILARLSAGETLREYPARLRCKDGSIRHVAISSNVLWEDGQFVHTRCFTRDVTRERAAEAALREEQRRKDDFLATLAHELRNPLAPVRNNIEVLQMMDLPAPGQRLVETMERQVRHLVRIVDDLMEVSRIARGKIGLQRQAVELAEIIHSAMETSRPGVEERGHTIELALPDEPVVIDGDPVRLAQIFSNLINNAARYSEKPGSIRISARHDDGEVIVSVADDGIGIPAEDVSKVFDMFVQIDDPRSGLGIGLTLVRTLVELHGGSVSAHSDGPGEGSEFVVRLPTAEHLVPAVPSEARPGAGLPACRVLTVDDNRDAADSLAMLLGYLGADAEVRYDGESALEAMRTYDPTVVLLDIGMEGMDGYEVARRIRAEPEYDGVRLIAITGWGMPRDRERARQAGFDEHLVKPVDIEVLRGVLDAL